MKNIFDQCLFPIFIFLYLQVYLLELPLLWFKLLWLEYWWCQISHRKWSFSFSRYNFCYKSFSTIFYQHLLDYSRKSKKTLLWIFKNFPAFFLNKVPYKNCYNLTLRIFYWILHFAFVQMFLFGKVLSKQSFP